MRKNEVPRGILLLCSLWCISASAQVVQPKVVVPDALLSPIASPLFCEKGVEYKPLPHFDAPTYSDGVPENGVQKQYAWPKTTAEINAKLPNIATEIGVTNFSASGTIAGIFGLSKNTKSIVIDFIKYRSEPIQSSAASAPSAYARVGVGMRLHLELSDVKADFAGSLMSLAAGVKGGNIRGTISAELMGIDSPDITQSMPFTSDLSDASIQRVIEAMAIVKSRLSDDKANLRPQLLARITCKP
jgi:hypothetical protein